MKYFYKIRLFFGIIVLILAIAGITGAFYPVKIFDVQFAPVLGRMLADFSVVAAVIFGGLIILSLLFGRLYCSTLCPLGILQEVCALILKKKNEFTPNYPVKYFLASIVFGLLIGGSAFALRFLEPYTYFGSLLSLSFIGIVAALIIFSILFFKNRFFCTNICPVGAILGLLSKISLNKIYIENDCVSCGNCERNCPAGAINSKEKTVDNTTCVKCLKCLEVCKKGAVKWGIKRTAPEFSPKRREIILSLAALGIFGAMFKAGIILKDRAVQKFKEIILPPGAQSKEEFLNKCFNCNLCVQNCPNKIIVKSNENFNAPHLDFERGFCDKNCNKCGEVCPTGAIKRLKLEEKQKVRIAMASINKNCINCKHCVSICPMGAISVSPELKPVVDGSKCTGCGKCKTVCKAGAIDIFAVKKQSTT